jgi:hypothetical protein
MKAADVAVALLNGFGAEKDTESQDDIDDERRKKKLATKAIGRAQLSGRKDRKLAIA